MKQKILVRLAALSVGAMGGAAFGHDHVIGGPQEDCSRYPWWCQGYCAELNICRSGNTPIGGPDCQNEQSNLALCETSPPPYVPTVPTVPVVIVVPPSPACPAGKHYSGGGSARRTTSAGTTRSAAARRNASRAARGRFPTRPGRPA